MESHLKKHKKNLEKVQKFATKLVPELRGMGYEERLKEFNLTTLGKNRRGRGDMIKIYQILRGIDRLEIEEMFKLNVNRRRRHGRKLETQSNHRDTRKILFTIRVMR
nr:uncharacterized protein LOC123757653 [Procambarus clarkii]